MKVLQLIDSLQAGGAERTAVNIANVLTSKIEDSFLCATRAEGTLKTSLDQKVKYLFLSKKSALDISAIIRLIRYIRSNKIDVIHAHSTSFFLATIVKFFNPKINLVWHDHYGNSEFLDQRKYAVLKTCSRYFGHIISVNNTLKSWANKHLRTKEISYLPNFAITDHEPPQTKLKGMPGKRLLHLANLRPQKDHETLFRAFKKVTIQYPEYTLHCVGKDFDDAYSNKIKDLLIELGLGENVSFYGSRKDITYIIGQSDIGVLSSKSEGLPLALLELGLLGKPVVTTDAGDCKEVILDKETGLLIDKENPDRLANSIMYLIENQEKARQFGLNLKKRIENRFSGNAYINKLLKIYQSL